MPKNTKQAKPHKNNGDLHKEPKCNRYLLFCCSRYTIVINKFLKIWESVVFSHIPIGK